jgi:hypothetical protein
MLSTRSVPRYFKEEEFGVVGYSPDSNDVSTEAEESPLLEAVTRKRLLKTQQSEKI